jgi:hypothetical protein
MVDGETGSTAGIDVDALMADVEAGNEINAPAAATEESTPAEPASQPTEAQKQAIQEMEFTWNGKPIKAPVDRFKQWASQGYDYAQKMQEFNARQAAFEKSQKEFEPLKQRYSEIDEYARQNPQWLEHVNQAYMQAIGQAESNGTGQSPEIMALKQELLELKSFKEELTSERQAAKVAEQDQKLSEEIQSIQDKYKDLDWATPNEHGKTLETQVLEFAIQNGIKNFEHAFKLFNHDSLIKLHASKAKEEQVKAKQAQTKAGLLGSTPAPTKEFGKVTNLKSKSYNDIAREALEELGLA